MTGGVFGTVVNCIDGRTQIPVNMYLRNNYNLDFVDTITEAGPVKILADKQPALESIMNRVNISIGKHDSKMIAIVAHHDCAGNPVSKEDQLIQLKKSLQTVLNRYPDMECIGLWVNDSWQVEKII